MIRGGAVLDTQRVASQISRVIAALDAAIADLDLSPAWEQLLEDLDAAGDSAAAIEGDSPVPVMALATALAVPALAERLREIGTARLEPSLDDAAWRLEHADARWRTADDDREFPMVIHSAASALEEVARQVAGAPGANLRQALLLLRLNGTITASERRRMMQVWAIRSRTPGAAHGAGRAPREVAGFVLLRVRRGLLDLLDAVAVRDRQSG